MQQWYDQRDYDAMRRSLMKQMPPSLRPTFKPLPAEESTDIYFPLTTATGTYKATGTITINKDLAQGLLKAVETPMLKVGDRVKILRPFTEEEKRKPPHWVASMDNLVGAEGVVDYIGESVSVKVGKGSYSWLPETLALVPAADEIAFGPFPSKEEIIAVRADFTYAPVWEAKSPTGELSFVRCYPNIGDVDTFASFRDTTYKKSEKFPAFADYSARPLDKDGKPFARKHLALTTGVTLPSPSIKVTDVGMTTTVQQPATVTAAEVVTAVNASGSRYAGGVSLGGKPLTQEAMTAAVEAICTEFNRHSYSVAVPVDPVTGRVVGPLPVPGTRENPVKVTVYPAEPAKLHAEQERKIADALRRLPVGSDPAAKPRSIDARAAERLSAKKEQWRDFPAKEEVWADPKSIWAFQRPDNSVFYGYFVTSATATGCVIHLQRCTEMGARVEGVINDPFVALRELKARVVGRGEPVINPPVTFTMSRTPSGWPVKITTGQSDVAYTTAHDVAEVRGTSDRPLGEVLTPTTTGERWVICSDDPEKVAAALRTIAERTNTLTSATTSATMSEQLGATMPTTDKPTSRMRRAITEATRRAPVELGLNQAHEAIVKQAARKFKGTAAEKKVVARFLTDLLGSEYGKAGLAAALATVIPQLAPLLGKHEGKADVLAEELATRSATILAVKAGSDLISLLGPLTAILSEMISSAEPPQITAGSGRSALDEISVTAADVAATAKR
jgi:hypothetical protein